VPLRHWKAVGLRHPSAARVSNLFAVEKSLIKRVLGRLATDDLAQLERELRAALGLGLRAAAHVSPARRDEVPPGARE
jgi:hypothetical protein